MKSITRRPILAVDWNSTLQNQIGEICRRTVLQPADFTCWDPPLGQRVGLTEANFTRWAWTDPTIQWLADPYPGAAQAIAALGRLAHIWIVTATSNPQLVPGWLRKHHIPYDRIIITQDKNEVEFATLIDDSPTTLERLSAQGRPVIRFALPWNAHLTHLPGLTGWENIKN